MTRTDVTSLGRTTIRQVIDEFGVAAVLRESLAALFRRAPARPVEPGAFDVAKLDDRMRRDIGLRPLVEPPRPGWPRI